MMEDSDNGDRVGVSGIDLTRRQFLKGAAVVVLLPSALALAEACGSSPSPPATASQSASPITNPVGTAILMDFPGWIGASETKNYQAQYPQATVKVDTNVPSTMSGYVQLIKQNPKAFDFSLGDISQVEQAKAAGIYQEPAWGSIPNIKNVSEAYRKAYPAVPNDYGKLVIGYRKDIVSPAPKSWADFWTLAPKYSGKVTVADNDRDTIGTALKHMGYSGNSTNEGELNKALQALTQLKPSLQAITSIDVGKGLAKGSIVMAECYDFDVALGAGSNKNVAWVMPEEGAVAYLEGFFPVKGSSHLDVVSSFLNFHLEPKNYADFVNTTGSAWVMPAADPYIHKAILNAPSLQPNPAIIAKVEFEKYLGEATALWTQIWEQFKAA
jgi:spermidine/putrescine transport system substrate-binding protein